MDVEVVSHSATSSMNVQVVSLIPCRSSAVWRAGCNPFPLPEMWTCRMYVSLFTFGKCFFLIRNAGLPGIRSVPEWTKMQMQVPVQYRNAPVPDWDTRRRNADADGQLWLWGYYLRQHQFRLIFLIFLLVWEKAQERYDLRLAATFIAVAVAGASAVADLILRSEREPQWKRFFFPYVNLFVDKIIQRFRENIRLLVEKIICWLDAHCIWRPFF